MQTPHMTNKIYMLQANFARTYNVIPTYNIVPTYNILPTYLSFCMYVLYTYMNYFICRLHCQPNHLIWQLIHFFYKVHQTRQYWKIINKLNVFHIPFFMKECLANHRWNLVDAEIHHEPTRQFHFTTWCSWWNWPVLELSPAVSENCMYLF